MHHMRNSLGQPMFVNHPDIQNEEALADFIRHNLITPPSNEIEGPYGVRPYVYADWTASGQSLKCIEEYIRDEVLPWYANTHTEASFLGQQMGAFREQARTMVKAACNANDSDVCIFTGNGSTAAVQKLADILEIRLAPGPENKVRRDALPDNERPVVLIGPWEHHSNILVWRETLARIIEVPACLTTGAFSYDNLISILQILHDQNQDRGQTRHPLLIGSFSAASNVTGITLDMRKVAKIMHEYGGLVVFDCAAWASHLPIDMNPEDGEWDDGPGEAPDAVVLLPHKLPGGPGCPGVLLAKKRIFKNVIPSCVGGGVVEHVSRDGAIWVEKSLQIAGSALSEREQTAKHLNKVWARWSDMPNIVLLGASPEEVHRVPTISFRIKGLHMTFVNTLMNNLFGIQARDGCFCAHTYMADLLGKSEDATPELQSVLMKQKVYREGAVRVSFPWFQSDGTVDYIVEAIAWISERGWRCLPDYQVDFWTGKWTHRERLRRVKKLSVRDLFVDRASPLKRHSGSEPDWTQVVQRLGTYLSGQAGSSISDSILEEETRDKSSRAENPRSFVTPLEAAQLRSSGVDRVLPDGCAEDAIARSRFLSTLLGKQHSVPDVRPDIFANPDVIRGSDASFDTNSATTTAGKSVSPVSLPVHPRLRWLNLFLFKRRSSKADTTRLGGL